MRDDGDTKQMSVLFLTDDYKIKGNFAMSSLPRILSETGHI